MLRLIAAAYEDGYALVRDHDDELYFVRSPYGIKQKRIMPVEMADYAISKYGFVSTYEVFNDWNRLITFLNDKKVKADKKLDPQARRDLIHKRMPLVIFLKYLDNIERELIPENRFDAAINLLNNLLNNSLIKDDDFLWGICINLMAYCQKNRQTALLKAKKRTNELS